jgi:hypothetical protein
MWCDRDERQATIVACLYRCPDKAKCKIYAQRYDFILDMPIQEKYLLKYGLPEYVVPDAIAKREKREAKEAKAAEKLAKKNAKEKKTADKERAAEEKVKAKRKVKSPAKKGTIPKKVVKAAVKAVAKERTNPTDLTGDW